MGDIKKLQEEMRHIRLTVQKLEELPATVNTLSEAVAHLTTVMNSFFANHHPATSSTAIMHSTASHATPEAVVLTPPDPTPSTIIVEHPHVEIAPLQATVSANQPHVVSTRKAAEIAVVPCPKTVICVGGLFHHSPTPSHLRVVSYGQSSSLVSPSSSNVVVPTTSFKGFPSLGSSSPLFADFAPPFIRRMPIEAFPFALLLGMPFDRGRYWLRAARGSQA